MFWSYLVLYRHWLPLFLVMTHKLTPPLCLLSVLLLPLPLAHLIFSLLFFHFFSLTICHLLSVSSSDQSILQQPSPGLWCGEGEMEGGLQWMSIPVVSEVTATQRSHWRQHWTPQFAHAGMCDIVTVQPHRKPCRSPFSVLYTLICSSLSCFFGWMSTCWLSVFEMIRHGCCMRQKL